MSVLLRFDGVSAGLGAARLRVELRGVVAGPRALGGRLLLDARRSRLLARGVGGGLLLGVLTVALDLRLAVLLAELGAQPLALDLVVGLLGLHVGLGLALARLGLLAPSVEL